MQEEQMKILDMIASGKITPQEGAALLEALNSGDSGRKEGPWGWHPHHHPHWGGPLPGDWGENRQLLRVRVLDNNTEQPLVNLSLPIGMLKWRKKIGKAFSDKFKNIFFDVENIDGSTEGKIVEAIDEKSNKKVEVWVE